MMIRRWSVLAVLCLVPTVARAADGERRQSFDRDWRFQLGDAAGAEATAFNDAGWRKLDVPHDWMIEGPPGKDPSLMQGPFDPKSPGGAGNGYLDGGVGWYRKHFARPPAGRHVEVEFDGVYMDSHAWLNGHDLGTHPYGYTSFAYDLTPYLTDGDNVIAVRTEVDQPCSRFYSGAGIYRHVWLTVTNPVHVAHWGTYVTADVNGRAASVKAQTTIVNDGGMPADFVVDATLVDPDGRVVGHSGAQGLRCGPSSHSDCLFSFAVAEPSLWTTEKPTLYTVVADVKVGGAVVDHTATPFGIRTVEFTVDHGMMLNGQHVPIRGVCDHHDLGCLGAAVNTRAIERQLEILKGFGVNAIRTSHYPPAPELLDLCDRMGFLVMDEAFDEWKHNKTKLGYGRFFDAWSERDITSMVDRDRNHPCVVLWSIGNEIPEQGDTRNGQAMAQRLTDLIHREDPTRPTTSALSNANGAVKTGFAKALGVFGVNYSIKFYTDPRVHGHVPMIGSETASALSSRGEYGLAVDKDGAVRPRKQFDHQVSDYDIVAPGWGNLAEDSLMALQRDPWMAGEFVWTGFDYIGEPTPYGWPSRSSYFGIVDLCGFPKDRYYLYQSQWTEAPMVHLVPQNWNWAELAGKPIPVWCYTNADAVELFLNGRSLGEQTTATDRVKLHLAWSVPYAPGTLKAVAKRGGKVVATDAVTTAGPAARLTVSVDRPTIRAGQRDLAFVTVGAVDANGVRCPTADAEVTFAVTGPGTIVGVGDGDATNHEPFKGTRHKLFNGMGLVVVQGGDAAGSVTVTATADGVKPATVEVGVR